MESQIIDWKRQWDDDNLKCICGFANTEGGTLVVGKNDNGEVVADLKNPKKLSEDLPNKIKQALGIIPAISLLEEDGRFYIEIKVKRYAAPISCNGKYYIRSGSTTQELTGRELDEFLLRAYEKTRDSLPVPNFQITDLENDALRLFREKAVASLRLSEAEAEVSDKALLTNMKLLDGSELTRAAVLLFHRDPEILTIGAVVKIAYFVSDADFLYQDEVKSSLISMPDKVIDLIYSKYFKGIVSYDGLQRVERFPLPRAALREAVLNAIVHKDYSYNTPIQIKIYDDRVIIHNAGRLPDNWTIADLMSEHASMPFNPLIANAFFRSRLIEAWGRGIEKINSALRAAGLKEAVYTATGKVITITFTTEKSSQVRCKVRCKFSCKSGRH